jgi:hypothetical protein
VVKCLEKKKVFISPPSTHGLQNSNHFFPSKDTILGKIEPSATLHILKTTKLPSPASEKVYHPFKHNPS